MTWSELLCCNKLACTKFQRPHFYFMLDQNFVLSNSYEIVSQTSRAAMVELL